MQLLKNNNILNEGYKNKLYIDKGIGPYVYFGKKKYFDLSYGSGTLILGHNSKTFKSSLNEINKKNISLFTEPNIYANHLSKKLKKINKNYNKFIFCNSGTEAVFKSLRIVIWTSPCTLLLLFEVCILERKGESSFKLNNKLKILEFCNLP